MRALTVVSTIAGLMLLAIPLTAQAQQAAPPPSAASSAVVAEVPAGGQVPAVTPATEPAPEDEEYVPRTRNVVDFGLRGSSIQGDSARYQRYRDLGDGLFLEGFRLHRQTGNNWLLDLAGDHVGRLDQRFTGAVVLPGKVKASVVWDQLPTLFSNTTQTLFTTVSPDVLTIDNGIQTQVQANAAALKNIAATNGTVFTLKSRRYIGTGTIEYIASPDFTFTQTYRHMDRNGSMPYGGSFGHGNFVETMAPVYHQMNDLNGVGEYSHGPVLVRAGYIASYFHNDFTSLTFDDPWRVSDITSASSRGRSSLAPSNSLFSVNGMASFKMPKHTRATAFVSTGILKDASDTPILPQTINTATTGLTPLERTTVNGEGRTTSTNLTFTSRPVRYLDINARYRSYNYDNRTPEFSIYQRVSYDNAPAASTTPITTEPFGIKRGNLDVDVRVVPRSAFSAGIGYSEIREDRSLRIYDKTTERITRLSFDSVGARWFSIRTKFEHSEKRGTLDEEAYNEMVAAGEQSGMIQFDIAPRNRNRATVLGTVNATENISFNASIGTGHDDYFQNLFGMRDNKHHVYSAGVDATPGDHVVLSLVYTNENYDALSRSRNANPGAQQNDETRNWATSTNDRVHSVIASAEIKNIAEKVDLRFSVDVSNARTAYVYTAGAVAGYLLPGENPNLVSSLPTPAQLPNTKSELGRGTADATYALTKHVGVGVTYWYERYRVSDFTLDQQATPTLNLANSLLTGYLYMPYTANTVWGRIIYRW